MYPQRDLSRLIWGNGINWVKIEWRGMWNVCLGISLGDRLELMRARRAHNMQIFVECYKPMMFGYQTTDTFWAAFRVGIR